MRGTEVLVFFRCLAAKVLRHNSQWSKCEGHTHLIHNLESNALLMQTFYLCAQYPC